MLQLVPQEALTERFAWALEFLQRKLGTDLGSYLEFGVYNGSSMLCLLEALRLAGDPPMRLYGFDSFQGLPPAAVHDDGGVWQAGQFSCPRHFAEKRISSARNHGHPVELIEGWYADTLSHGDIYGIGSASLVMIDSDTYSSAQLALAFSAGLLTNPAIIMFDDWRLNDLDVKSLGEYRAFKEWVGQYPEIRVENVRSYNRKSVTLILRS